MIKELNKLLDNVYAPYSNFRVAAIVETSDGVLFSGVNIENASYGNTVCAERVAILKAVSEGYRNFKCMHVLCADSKKLSMPCFICRQTISEFFDKEANIYIYNNEESKVLKVKELCPFPFNDEDLK
ncbi:MAG: cytidine deaminase [Mycoplasmatota bacterium]